MPVATEKRRIAADTLRKYFRQEIKSDDFVGRFPKAREDRVLAAIRDVMWVFYSDNFSHYMFNETRAKPEVRSLYERCILFLEGDQEYEWPKLKVTPLDWVRDLVGSEKGRLLTFKQLAGHQDFAAWPFKNQDDLEAARQSHGRLILD